MNKTKRFLYIILYIIYREMFQNECMYSAIRYFSIEASENVRRSKLAVYIHASCNLIMRGFERCRLFLLALFLYFFFQFYFY